MLGAWFSVLRMLELALGRPALKRLVPST